ncbi:MAG: hypothetical protein FOGNACKC_00855 [Anaerolineae bacterium]|nr:hypothetical protein [Anaerolineae bacterium]
MNANPFDSSRPYWANVSDSWRKVVIHSVEGDTVYVDELRSGLRYPVHIRDLSSTPIIHSQDKQPFFAVVTTNCAVTVLGKVRVEDDGMWLCRSKQTGRLYRVDPLDICLNEAEARWEGAYRRRHRKAGRWPSRTELKPVPFVPVVAVYKEEDRPLEPEEYLDTEFDHNPHPGTGIMRGKPWTSSTNNYRLW